MSLLATSTPGHRNPVRILFYGQSITKQEWSQQVAQDIRTRFPYPKRSSSSNEYRLCCRIPAMVPACLFGSEMYSPGPRSDW